LERFLLTVKLAPLREPIDSQEQWLSGSSSNGKSGADVGADTATEFQDINTRKTSAQTC
jgi:hypothetical protein